MPERHEIYADEAWTHGSSPLRRYWCFFGGVMGSESNLAKLDGRLRAVKKAHKISGEVKWTALRPSKVKAYKAFIDVLLSAIENGEVRYRQMFCDRSRDRVPPFGEAPLSELDVQFRICYQFLKHSFGLEYLDPSQEHEVLVRLDTHSSQKHKKSLASFCKDLPRLLNHPRLTLKITYAQSDDENRIQACDLVIGAAGSWGNRMHLLRASGQRGMTDKQKARVELSRHIYSGLRAIDSSGRGTGVFHWFESTGKDGDRTNLLNHKIRVWKFCPRLYRIDEGWLNKNLGKQGEYLSRQLNPRVHTVGYDPFTY